MSKLRITVDIEIDDEAREELNITEETIMNSMRVEPDDVMDGVLIFQSVEGLDPTSDIVLGDGVIVSKEISSKNKNIGGAACSSFLMSKNIFSHWLPEISATNHFSAFCDWSGNGYVKASGVFVYSIDKQ